MLWTAVYETSALCFTPFQWVQRASCIHEFSDNSVSDSPVVFHVVRFVCWRFCWQTEDLWERLKQETRTFAWLSLAVNVGPN